MKPDVVQTWMYHADVVGGVITRLAGMTPVIWNVRNASLEVGIAGLSTRILARVSAVFSWLLPTAIISNSQKAVGVHQALGYRLTKFVVIPNGYDLSRFYPDFTARHRIRKEWLIAEDEVLVGMVARWDPYKDHETFLKALAALVPKECSVRYVLIGEGMDYFNSALISSLQAHGLADHVLLKGSHADIPAVMNALDLHVLSSASEAFPNVVAEAMACGTPCVVTDVGDAALIVGDTGWVLPPGAPLKLARTIEMAISVVNRDGKVTIGKKCRERIAEKFSEKVMVTRYVALWRNVSQK